MSEATMWTFRLLCVPLDEQGRPYGNRFVGDTHEVVAVEGLLGPDETSLRIDLPTLLHGNAVVAIVIEREPTS